MGTGTYDARLGWVVGKRPRSASLLSLILNRPQPCPSADSLLFAARAVYIKLAIQHAMHHVHGSFEYRVY
jgi:hypothetical protein